MTLFGPEQLRAAVKAAQAAVPVGHDNAVIGTLDATGAQVVVTLKLKDDHWRAMIVGHHDWSGENSGGASLIYSWAS